MRNERLQIKDSMFDGGDSQRPRVMISVDELQIDLWNDQQNTNNCDDL